MTMTAPLAPTDTDAVPGSELAGVLTAELVAGLPAGAWTTDPDVVEGMSRDQAAWAPHGRPAAVIRATCTADVVHVVRTCLRHGVPVVARGAGTGLSGGANALEGCVVLSLERMDRVVEINRLERLAVVQPGVVNDALRAAVAEHGLWYPPDPASSPWSTIGGNGATNAGSLCCVKYGVTRDYVLQLEVVTGRGDVVRLGRRTAKGVAGYDLMGLLVRTAIRRGVVIANIAHAGDGNLHPLLVTPPGDEEARARAELSAEVLQMHRAGSCATGDDLGLYRSLFSRSGRADLTAFVGATVGPLLDHDREKQRDLAVTLETYLEQARHHARTCEALHIHANTLYQRLDRITEVLEPRWKEPGRALELQVALRLHRLIAARSD